MQRGVAFLLVALGLVAVVVGTISGCGAFFSYNGRHPIAVEPLVPGVPLRKSFGGKAHRRYTLAVQAVFDREGLPEANGNVVLEAKLPLVASIEDTSGVAVVKTVGWLDPSEPPTVLHGQVADEHQRRPRGEGPAELVAERLVGPYPSPGVREVTFNIDLGTDIVGKASLKEARVVIFDDELPRSITVAVVAVVAVVAGSGALLVGAILLFFGLFRSRRGGKRRSQIV